MSITPDSSNVSRLYEAADAYRSADDDESRRRTLQEYNDASEAFLDVDILPRMVAVYVAWQAAEVITVSKMPDPPPMKSVLDIDWPDFINTKAKVIACDSAGNPAIDAALAGAVTQGQPEG